MSKVFLLVFDSHDTPRELVTAWAEASPLVTAWRSDLPNCFYFASASSAAQLSQGLREAIPHAQRFFFTQISRDRQGMMPKETWHFLSHGVEMPKPATVAHRHEAAKEIPVRALTKGGYCEGMSLPEVELTLRAYLDVTRQEQNTPMSMGALTLLVSAVIRLAEELKEVKTKQVFG